MLLTDKLMLVYTGRFGCGNLKATPINKSKCSNRKIQYAPCSLDYFQKL